jgi:exosortase
MTMSPRVPESLGFSRRNAGFAAFFTASLVLAIDTIRQLVEYSLTDRSASHVILVPFLSVALLWMGRHSIFASVRSWWPGLAVVGAGVCFQILSALRLLPDGAASLSLSIAALIVVWIGGFLTFYGTTAFKAGLFPILFLVFTIPIPDAALARIVLVLKTGSADAVSALFTLTATPYYRAGFVFELPTVAIEIADECSGIRSSVALALTSLLAGHLFLDSPWKKVVLVLVVLPIAILKNAIRIATLSLLAIHVDRSFLVGQLHHDGGVVFFLLALVLLVSIMSLLGRYDSLSIRLPRSFHSFYR